jgi:glutathione S-transferase
MMKLWHSGASPFVRKTMVTAHEFGRLPEIEIFPVATTVLKSDPDLRKRNPLGKVPALELADGQVIFDSRVICAYLIETADGAAKRQDLPGDRLKSMVLEALGDGIMDAAVNARYEKALRPERYQFQEWIDGQLLKVDTGLDALERDWTGVLNGPLNGGTIAAACALAYLDFRYENLAWRDGRRKLAGWFDTFNDRPSMRETVPA